MFIRCILIVCGDLHGALQPMRVTYQTSVLLLRRRRRRQRRLLLLRLQMIIMIIVVGIWVGCNDDSAISDKYDRDEIIMMVVK